MISQDCCATPRSRSSEFFVEDEKGAKIGGLLERRGDRFFQLAEPHRAEIGEPLFQDVQIQALGQVMGVGRLSRSGRTRETEGEGSRPRSRNLVGQFDEIDVSGSRSR